MYEFHKEPEGPPARSASTLLVVREVPEFQLFFVVRHKRSAFLGGAMVFPGGKLDDDDALVKTTGVPERALRLADERPELAEALAVCACRETLEEAGLCPTKPGLPAERIGHQPKAIKGLPKVFRLRPQSEAAKAIGEQHMHLRPALTI